MKPTLILLIILLNLHYLSAQESRKTRFGFSIQPLYSELFGLKPDGISNFRNWQYEETLYGKYGGEVGLITDFPIKKKLWIKTGISIINRGYITSYPQGWNIYYSNGILDSVFMNSKYQGVQFGENYFSIPVILGLDLRRNNTFALILRAGTSVDFLWLTTIYESYSTNTQSSWIFKGDRADWFTIDIPLVIGAQICFFITGMEASLEPQVNITILDRMHQRVWKPRYITYGLNFSFCIYDDPFKKE